MATPETPEQTQKRTQRTQRKVNALLADLQRDKHNTPGDLLVAALFLLRAAAAPLLSECETDRLAKDVAEVLEFHLMALLGNDLDKIS
jgi:hypothetical protein